MSAQKEKNINKQTIDNFNPDTMSFEQSCQDFLLKILEFDAGSGYENFNDFIKEEASDYQNSGDGVTYVVWNVFYDKNDKEIDREIMGFYTLATGAIPYTDRIRLDEIEAKETGKEFDEQTCGLPIVEIKMFAISKKYQDIFYEYADEVLPVSAWIMRNIILNIKHILDNVVGFKGIFLHSLPDAESFYLKNGFSLLEKNMQALYSVDSEYTPMYLTLKPVYINYDE